MAFYGDRLREHKYMATFINSRDFVVQLMDALGLTGRPITKIVIEVEAKNMVPKVYIQEVLTVDRADGVVAAAAKLQQFELNTCKNVTVGDKGDVQAEPLKPGEVKFREFL